jgi:hypothetical protein
MACIQLFGDAGTGYTVPEDPVRRGSDEAVAGHQISAAHPPSLIAGYGAQFEDAEFNAEFRNSAAPKRRA